MSAVSPISRTAKSAGETSLLREHPLLTQNFRIPTPDVLRLEKSLRLWHRAGITGGLLLGTTRIGKTTAVDECIINIRDIFSEPCFAVRINWCPSTRTGQQTFFLRLLEGLRHPVLGRTMITQLETRFIERLLTLTADTGGQRCVLFIDEAHCLLQMELQWLCHVFNAVRDRGFALMVILVGQPEMRETRTLSRDSGNTQVIGRFMRTEFVFNGIETEPHLERILAWIDDKSEYPVKSGRSFLQAFIPKAVEGGFRLDRLSGRLWSTYLEWRPKQKADQHAGMVSAMSMMTLSSLIKTLVQELASNDSASLIVSDRLLAAIMKLIAVEHG